MATHASRTQVQTPGLADNDAAERSSLAIAPGDCIGRYTILEMLGEGGMGEVYSAHDPELDRTIAIKLLRAETADSSPEARARFQREAQTMAKLNHPNVVSVYDVGTVGDRTFVAMEKVEGLTLSDWLMERPRSWSEVRTVFLAAGRGLEAAHAAGIVHRDFKPSNVIVGDRVRVLDFGIARRVGEPNEHPTTSGREAVDLEITRTGQVMGTPSYMAPEQRSGGPPSVLGDQYAFGVALREALTGVSPDALGGGAASKSVRVPAHLRRIVERALRQRPEERYPSMTDLLARLERDSLLRRTSTWLAAGAVTVALAAVAGARANPAAECAHLEGRLAGVWDAAHRDAVRAAFLRVNRHLGQLSFVRVGETLDGYARSLDERYVETCRATRVEGRQSDHLMDLRMACLDRRRAVVTSLIDLWLTRLDDGALATAHESATRLPSLAECDDQRALAEPQPLPDDPALRFAIAALRAKLAGAQAQLLAGRGKEASEAASRLRAEADATGWEQVRAEVAYAEGVALTLLHDPGAEAHLLAAAKLAGAARDDRLSARALVALVDTLGFDQQQASRALLAADIADGALLRSGDPPELRVKLMLYRANALMATGRFGDARPIVEEARRRSFDALGRQHPESLHATTILSSLAWQSGSTEEAKDLSEQNLAAMTAVFGAEHPVVVSQLTALGGALIGANDFAAADRAFRRALEIEEKLSGPDAASTAVALANVGAVDIELDRLEEADTMLSRTLQIRERLEPDHQYVSIALTNLAIVRRKQGRYAEAHEVLQRALRIKEKSFPPGHPTVAWVYEGEGEVAVARGEFVEAVDSFRRAHQARLKAFGEEHWLTLHSRQQLASVLIELRRCSEARPLLEAVTRGLGERHPEAAIALAATGECDLLDRRPEEALQRAERAISQHEKTGGRLPDRGAMRWVAARALQALGRTADAVATAKQAERELAVEERHRALAPVRTFLKRITPP